MPYPCRSSQGGNTPEPSPSSGSFRSGGLRAGKGGVASRYASAGAFGSQPKSTGSGSSFSSPAGRSAFMPPGAAAAGAKVSLHFAFTRSFLHGAKSYVFKPGRSSLEHPQRGAAAVPQRRRCGASCCQPARPHALPPFVLIYRDCLHSLPQVGFFMPGADAAVVGAGGVGGSAFAKPGVSFFNPGAPAAVDNAGGDSPTGDQQQPGSPELPAVRTTSGKDAAGGADSHGGGSNGTLHWASSQALLSAEDGAASPPPVKQVSVQELPESQPG